MTSASRRTIGTAKARLLATIDVIRASVAALPEPACVVLEEARVLDAVRNHTATIGHVTEVFAPTAEAVRSIGRAVKAMQGFFPAPSRRRR